MPSSLHPYSIVKEQKMVSNQSITIYKFFIDKRVETKRSKRDPNPIPFLVEMSGFEPPTPCVQGRCSPAELHPLLKCGLRNFNSELRVQLVGLDRFELSTSRLSGVRSNQLSYRPFLNQNGL
jgi:hypothetical protein